MRLLPILALSVAFAGQSAESAGPYAGAAGQQGSTAISKDDPAIRAWATGYVASTLERGWLSAANESLGTVSHGSPSDALGKADVDVELEEVHPVISLGDGGSITLTFAEPIADGPSFDFAVFENGFQDTFLELAFVEVSSDGEYFSRFPAVSLTGTEGGQENPNQDSFSLLDPTNLHNLAGKYIGGYGTPFDLAELPMDPKVNKGRITHVRVVDVVGSTNPAWGTRDSGGRLIKDPFPTRFETGGFDLDAIGVLNQVPEPGAVSLLAAGAALLGVRRRGLLTRRN
ncbi:MAG: PEP-CTERM sorting domain-containing protein [Chthoniobacteraceae bacterium]